MGLRKHGVGLAIALCLIALVSVKIHQATRNAVAPNMPRNVWWGAGMPRKLEETVVPFKINVSDQILEDLKRRLSGFLEKAHTPPLEGVGFQYGFNTDYLRRAIQYWRDEYKWRPREVYLNTLPQYTTHVNGIKIHFIRVLENGPITKRTIPLLLLHGWPGSIREFYDLIPLLSQSGVNQDFTLELVAPSLPGFGFSEAASKPGMGSVEMAVVINNFMEIIGIEKYYVHGGDWGSVIARNLAQLYPDRVLGLHSTMCKVNTGAAFALKALGNYFPRLLVKKEHEDKFNSHVNSIHFQIVESGYFHLQATKPFTIGAALEDSPAGLFAYTMEKVSTGTNWNYRNLPDGGITLKYPLDTWLDNVMIYWVTNSITTSFYIYAEHYSTNQRALNMESVAVNVPTACARFRYDVTWYPEMILSLIFKNIVQISDYDEGGHFPSLEVPAILANDILSAINKMEHIIKN